MSVWLSLFKEFLGKYAELGTDVAGTGIFGPFWPIVKPGVRSALKILENKLGSIKSSKEKMNEAIKILEKDKHLKKLIYDSLKISFDKLSKDHYEILEELHKIGKNIECLKPTQDILASLTKKDYALAIRSIFLRKAFDPDVARHTHGLPVAWRQALHDTRRALTTGVWMDREGNKLGNIPLISKCPISFLPLIQAVERALAYCVADLDEELKAYPLYMLPEKINYQDKPYLHDKWVIELGLDPQKAKSETDPYVIEEIIQAIIHQLNNKIFIPLNINTVTERINSISKEEIDKSLHLLDKKIKDRQIKLDPKAWARFKNDQSGYMTLISDNDKERKKTIQNYKKALEIMKNHDIGSAGAICRRIANIYSSMQESIKTNLEKAAFWYDKAGSYFKKARYQNDVAWTLILKSKINKRLISR